MSKGITQFSVEQALSNTRTFIPQDQMDAIIRAHVNQEDVDPYQILGLAPPAAPTTEQDSEISIELKLTQQIVREFTIEETPLLSDTHSYSTQDEVMTFLTEAQRKFAANEYKLQAVAAAKDVLLSFVLICTEINPNTFKATTFQREYSPLTIRDIADNVSEFITELKTVVAKKAKTAPKPTSKSVPKKTADTIAKKAKTPRKKQTPCAKKVATARKRKKTPNSDDE